MAKSTERHQGSSHLGLSQHINTTLFAVEWDDDALIAVFHIIIQALVKDGDQGIVVPLQLRGNHKTKIPYALDHMHVDCKARWRRHLDEKLPAERELLRANWDNQGGVPVRAGGAPPYFRHLPGQYD